MLMKKKPRREPTLSLSLPLSFSFPLRNLPLCPRASNRNQPLEYVLHINIYAEILVKYYVPHNE